MATAEKTPALNAAVIISGIFTSIFLLMSGAPILNVVAFVILFFVVAHIAYHALQEWYRERDL